MNKKYLFHLSVIFVIIEITLEIIAQTSIGNRWTDYFAVILACLFFIIFTEQSASYVFTQIGLIFTVVADYFLVYLNPQNQFLGVIFFILVQFAYFLRLVFEEQNSTVLKIHLATRFLFPIPVLIIAHLVLGESSDILAIVSVFYFTNLFLNIVFSIAGSPKSKFFTLGLICFILCDLVVGFANLEAYFNISQTSIIYMILHSDLDLVWFFYIPSQTLLALSLIPNNKKIKRV